MHSVTDRRTDGRTDRQTNGQQAAANSRSYCVAVRSAKNRIESINGTKRRLQPLIRVFWARNAFEMHCGRGYGTPINFHATTGEWGLDVCIRGNDAWHTTGVAAMTSAINPGEIQLNAVKDCNDVTGGQSAVKVKVKVKVKEEDEDSGKTFHRCHWSPRLSRDPVFTNRRPERR